MTQRTAVVTGGMGGLGESISTKMHDAGYKVVVTYSPGNKTHAGWVADMKAKGVKLINEKPTVGAGGKQIAFIHPSSANGVLVEFVTGDPVTLR